MKDDQVRELNNTELDAVSGGVLTKAGGDAFLWPTPAAGGVTAAYVWKPKEGLLETAGATDMTTYSTWTAKAQRAYLLAM